ncbi:hypothetical protein [Carboxydothermus ferrireducens]|uniref:Cytochrome c domain-containing protein n=1 Tax=Carboxydothermus ferrireducens DSM 11255 TaxID=1119529 RepID=A0ABX2R6E1_9THEO|nr:hypothetical protein [Carboxydothermus ferrireducens]NYE56480.1 hypothetical protein [Carboxydothermus ferrireducens DSM 11255]
MKKKLRLFILFIFLMVMATPVMAKSDGSYGNNCLSCHTRYEFPEIKPQTGSTITEAQFVNLLLEKVLQQKVQVFDREAAGNVTDLKYLADTGLVPAMEVNVKNPNKGLTRLEAAGYLAQVLKPSLSSKETAAILSRLADRNKIPSSYQKGVAYLLKYKLLTPEAKVYKVRKKVNGKWIYQKETRYYFNPGKIVTNAEAINWINKIKI